MARIYLQEQGIKPNAADQREYTLVQVLDAAGEVHTEEWPVLRNPTTGSGYVESRDDLPPTTYFVIWGR